MEWLIRGVNVTAAGEWVNDLSRVAFPGTRD